MFFSLIARTLWARRTRSLLTALGVGISIAVIIAIFTLSAGLKEGLGEVSEITQADLVAIQKGLAGPSGGSIPQSSIKDIAQCEGVRRTTGFLLATVSLPDVFSFNLFGVIPEDRELYFGEPETIEGKYIQNRGEMALGRIAMGNLGLQVGSTLEMETGEEFTVVGTYQTGNVYLDSGGVVSLEEAQKIVGREGKITLIAIYLAPGADKDGVIQQIESKWRYLRVLSSSHFLEASTTVRSINTFAWVLSLVALIMGCIGIVNTMSMSVAERTREIGILRAIGWGRLRILRLVLGESVLLSLMGFGIGSLLGAAILWLAASLPLVQGFISFSFSYDVFVKGLAMALLLGLLGGAFPAYRALRLSPAEALRYG